jgi:hypothetical protein
MEDDTTTAAAVEPTGADEALPVENDVTDTAAEATTTDASETSQDAPADNQPSAPQVDDKLKKYAESQGFELDSPGAIKAAQAGLKAQAEATRNYQKAQELEKATSISPEQLPADITPEQRDNVRVRNLEMKLDIQTWKSQNQDKLALEPEMIKVLSDPNKKTLVQEGYLSLDDVYSLAKANAPDNSDAVKSQGKREALESLAHKQQAAVPAGHATNSATTPKEKPFAELSIKEMEAKLGHVRQ